MIPATIPIIVEIIMVYVYLSIAIIFEVMATTALKASDSFTKLTPSLLTIAGYAITFYFLALTLKTLPTGIAYAIWSGVGIVLISLISWLYFKQNLDLPAMIGIGFIIVGVLIINIFSKSVAH